MVGARSIRPSAISSSYPYGTVGTAIDYRVRYYFGVTPWSELVASKGAFNLVGVRPISLSDGKRGLITRFDPRVGPNESQRSWLQLVTDFRDALTAHLDAVRPVARRLSAEDEGLLCRYCYALALFEEMFRTIVPVSRSPLGRLGVGADVAELLSLADDAVVADLVEMSTAFHDEFNEMMSKPAILNPTFTGSGDVGGADADLIVDGCLIEVKTAISPSLKGEWIHQLLGYVLLDYDDHHAIDGVGVYFARQMKLVRWSLDELFELLGTSVEVLPQLRRDWQQLLKG